MDTSAFSCGKRRKNRQLASRDQEQPAYCLECAHRASESYLGLSVGNPEANANMWRTSKHGLIQPVTVRPNASGFEIVAGARRFRASQLAELFSIPARIVELDDAAAMEWQLAAGTGLPQTPVYFATVPGTGQTGTIRPDETGASPHTAPSGLYLNPAAYTAPLSGQWGNAGRDSITGPNQFSLDASLGRTFRLKDRFNLDLRIDSTNLLNHGTFTSWITTINNAQFGLPAAVNPMRSLQTTLRLRY
jgi:hypothetical protein